MTTASHSRVRPVTPAAARLTRIAGWWIVAVAALHIAVFTPLSPWGEWFAGSLRTADPDPESVALFWALPGGLAFPAILVGLLVARLGRQRQRVGLGFAFALVAWVACCVWLIGPSGFLGVLGAAGLLIAAAVVDHRSRA